MRRFGTWSACLARLERELHREFGPGHVGGGSTSQVAAVSSEHEVQRRASRAIDRALRRLGFGNR